MCPRCPHCSETKTPCQDRFGSNAELMGGQGGRSDGLVGAVESQKTTGTLHLHFWNFIQRAHQYLTLEEIGHKLEDALLKAEDLKRFCEHICCESYPSTEKIEAQLETIEKRWPKFHEEDESINDGPVCWGKNRFGRIPSFVWEDAGTNYTALYKSNDNELWNLLKNDAMKYEASYKEALQEHMLCAQHHIHRKDPVTGERKIPNACRSARDAQSCKHDFPMDCRMNTDKPLVICKGIATKRKLHSSGKRNMLGGILNRRNNPWINGTAPGMVIGISGSNSDVKLNDLLPILPSTHESAVCFRKKCIPLDPEKKQRIFQKMTRRLHTKQARMNGYFGGYIGKAQKCGKLEIKKCIDKMHRLRERQQGKSPAAQNRAVSGRMITDIEMNGTLRGAVEEFNLSINANSHDVLAAECIRTYKTIHVDAQNWLHRMEVELERTAEIIALALVPKTRKPNIRSTRVSVPQADVYGFRPLAKTPFRLLSPYEFLRFWEAVPLTPPRNPKLEHRTQWTSEGENIKKSMGVLLGKTKLVPGVHYIVKEPTSSDEYYTFSERFPTLRHNWIIIRRRALLVPVLEGAPLPACNKSDEYNAKYLSLFFRPWTLIAEEATHSIPHLSRLGMHPDHNTWNLGEQHKDALSFKASWRWYIQGNVVSEYAATLITSMLTNTLARSNEEDCQSDDEADASDIDDEIQPLEVKAHDFRGLLTKDLIDDSETPKKRKNGKHKGNHNEVLSTIRNIWGNSAVSYGTSLKEIGPMHSSRFKEHIAAKRQAIANTKTFHPYSEERNPTATLYDNSTNSNLDKWRKQLPKRAEPPTKEHLEFLDDILDYFKQESAAENANNPDMIKREPPFYLIHGVPGAGKSRIIQLLREAFENILNWQHGIHFVCLAFQNAMAAAINGFTIHHWSGIQIKEDGGCRDSHTLSTKCQSLKVIIIDEISMPSAELIAQLEIEVTKVTRKRRTRRYRKDNTQRPFGGLVVLFFGDFCQLKPVHGTAIFSDPTNATTVLAHHGLQLFWGEPPNAVHKCWNFTTSLRCDDAWYNIFLDECRKGMLSEIMYNTIHGFPTPFPMSIGDKTKNINPCACECSMLHEDKTITPAPGVTLYKSWAEKFLRDGASPEDLINLECTTCANLRRTRCRVLNDNYCPKEQFSNKPFDTAPALFAFNVPRYFAIMHRARQYARNNNVLLQWCVARDIPLNRDDRELPTEQLQKKMLNYLQLHDQATSNISSIIPLANIFHIV